MPDVKDSQEQTPEKTPAASPDSEGASVKVQPVTQDYDEVDIKSPTLGHLKVKLPPDVRKIMTDPDATPDEKKQTLKTFIAKRLAAIDPAKGGHKRHIPFDMSGTDPTEKPYKGTIAPRLAGDRAKLRAMAERVKKFVDKYHQYAIDRFDSAKATSVKKVGANDLRVMKKGGIAGGTQLMPKEQVDELLARVDSAPSDEVSSVVRSISNYVWAVHSTIRKEIRSIVKGEMEKQGVTKAKTQFNQWTGKNEPVKSVDPKTGFTSIQQEVDKDHPSYESAFNAASKEFNDDSKDVIGAINVMSDASGELSTSAGFGSEADKTFLYKKNKRVKDPDDPEGERKVTVTTVHGREPDVKLPHDLGRMADPDKTFFQLPKVRKKRGPDLGRPELMRQKTRGQRGADAITGPALSADDLSKLDSLVPSQPAAPPAQAPAAQAPSIPTGPKPFIPRATREPASKKAEETFGGLSPEQQAMIDKLFMKKESLDKFIKEMMLVAEADASPAWYDDL